MPRLYNKNSGAFLGAITEADLKSLVEQLEETDRADDDYFVDTPTIDLLEEAGASSGLVGLLRRSVGTSEGIDIRYEP